MVKFSNKIGQTWIDVMIADVPYTGILLNFLLTFFLAFKDDYHLRQKDNYKLL